MNLYYLLPGFILFFLFYFLIFLVRKKYKKILIFIIYLAVLNGIFLIIANFFPLANPAEFKLSYVLAREGVIYSFFSILLLNKVLIHNKVKRVYIYPFLYLVVGIFLIMSHGHPSVTIRIGGFKELYNFVFLFFIGAFISVKDEEELILLGKSIIKFGLFLSMVVFIEWLMSLFYGEFILSKKFGLGKYFYLMFSASEKIYGSPHMFSDININILPGNFNSEFGLRYSGISLDPASFALFMTFPLIGSLLFKRKVSSIIFLATILLSFGKAGIILAAAIVIYYLLMENKKISLICIIIITLFFCTIFYNWLFKILSTGSALPHIMFFLDGLKILVNHPIGYGMGHGGGMGYMAGTKGVGDTFWGSVISQAGIVGLTFFIISLLMIVKYLRKKINTFQLDIAKKFTKTLAFTIFIGLLISTVSGAVFLWNAMGIHMIFAGIVVGMKSGDFIHQREKNEQRQW